MGSFLEMIQSFFNNIFTSDPQEKLVKKELRLVHQELKALKPRLYQTSPKAFLPALGQHFYNLYLNLLPIYEVLSKTIGHKEPGLNRNFKNYLLESLLGSNFAEKRESFQYENIKRKLEGAPNREKESIKIRDELKNFSRRVMALDKSKFNLAMAEVNHLWELCNYPFSNILAFFDVSLDLSKIEKKPSFSLSSNKMLSQELKDFYYLWGGINFNMDFLPLLTVLEKRLYGEHLEKKKDQQKILNNIHRYYSRELPPTVILNLIKAWDEDPLARLPVNKEQPDEIKLYLESIENLFIKDMERALRELKENTISDDLKVLFESQNLEELENYCYTKSQAFEDIGLPGFSKIKPLQILYNHMKIHYLQHLKDPINKLLIEGFYDRKNFQNSLTEHYYQCEKIIEDINNFDQILGQEGRHSVVILEQYMREIKSGVDRMELSQRIIDSINKRAGEILEEKTQSLYGLTSQLQDILQDFKKPTPEIISNIKSFGNPLQTQDSIISDLVEGFNRNTQFLKIIKQFVVLKKPM